VLVDLNSSENIETLVPLLHAADEDDARIRQTIMDAAHTAYLASVAGEPIGAAVMRWEAHESELVYIAIAESQRGQGYGKIIVACLLDEAKQRGVQSVLVGTANAGLDNIAFYQKCGFRMDSVRRDYFAYFKEPVYENGIRIQDMLMLRWMVEG
jgi:N-acetylglutamate synthase-like GNAT family acetyltransferase